MNSAAADREFAGSVTYFDRLLPLIKKSFNGLYSINESFTVFSGQNSSAASPRAHCVLVIVENKESGKSYVSSSDEINVLS
jgi:hypothetical protein